MREFTINCPHCGALLEASDEHIGLSVQCPSCSEAIQVSEPSEPQPPSISEVTPPKQQTKDCPYCGEEILAKAKKCKHCGEILDVALKRKRQVAAHRSRASSQTRSQPVKEKVIVKSGGEGCFLQTLNIGCAIILIIIVVIVLFVIGVINM